MNLQIEKNNLVFIKFSLFEKDKVVGRAFLYLIKNDLHPQPYGLLEDLFIEESFRREGRGKKLVQAVIEEAKKQKCYKLLATSRFSRDKVHQFYLHLGFKEYGKEFRMDF